MHASISESMKKIRTPIKTSYIHRTEASLIKEEQIEKMTNGVTSNSILPTIIQTGGSANIKEGKAVVIKRRNSKLFLTSLVPNRILDKANVVKKEPSLRKQKSSKEAASSVQKTKMNSEYLKVKATGILKYFPKLWIDVPMMTDRIKHNSNCIENEGKWNYRDYGRQEYQRRDQYKNLDGIKNHQVVFDNVDKSPFYSDPSYPYFDEKKLIPTSNSDSGSQQNRPKPRGFRRAIINSGIPRKDKVYTSLNPYYKVEDSNDWTLVFESRFESGNLKRATQVADYEYDWTVQNDYNSQGISQWYYFRVGNTRAETKYTFNLFNFYKPDSLYNQGMRPLMYSCKKASLEGIGWTRWGINIWYYQNSTKRKSGQGFLYSLSFSVELPYDSDEVYFCHWYPYTYRDSKEHLDRICSDNKKGKPYTYGLEGRVNMKDKIRKTELCKSLAENSLDLVIITNFSSSDKDISKREAIIITSRVHPGETNASFIVEGILDFLVSDFQEAIDLRDKYVFKVVPMLNPDGVVVGNYRCSLSGQDLNRQWVCATSRVFPEIYFTKQMFRKTVESRKIFMFVDIHGHSRKRNTFMYGCNNKNNEKKHLEKVFPFRLSKQNGSFSFDDCNFNIQKERETTGRVAIRKEFSIINSYTLEASFFGPDKGIYQDCHFTPGQLKNVGRSFWVALNDMDDDESKIDCLKQLEVMFSASNN